MKRRDMLKLTLASAGLAALPSQAAESCPGDGTPVQFMPKSAPDADAAKNDIKKYPHCPYCGMSREKFDHSRMLVQYSDDVADGTCSIHCAAISLSLNIDREPKAIYVGDNAVEASPKPLVDVDKASFLIGSDIKGVMTKRSKVAFGGEEVAKAAQAKHGGELADFDKALTAAYLDMAGDVKMIRKMREERRKKMMEKKA